MATQRDRKKRQERVVSARRWADEQGKFDRPYIKIPAGMKQFRPEKDKEYVLDILPFIAGEGNSRADKGMAHWERTFRVHKQVGPAQKSYLCLEDHCPICAERKRLRNDGVDWQSPEMKATNTSERQLFLVRLRGSKEIMLWDEANWNFGKYLKALLDRKREKFGDKYDLFADPNKGFSLEIGTKEETAGGGRGYVVCPSVNFIERKEQPGDEIYDVTPCLDDLLVALSPKDLEEIYFQTGNSEEEVAERNSKYHKPEEDEDDDEPEESSDLEEDTDEDEPAPKKKKSKVIIEDEDEDEDDEPAPKKKSKKPVIDEDEDEDDEPLKNEEEDSDEDEDDEEPTPKKKKFPTAKECGIMLKQMVEHPKHGECEVVKISPDGTSLTLEDEDGDRHMGIGPEEVEALGADTEVDDEDEDEDDEPTPKKKGKKPALDEDEDDDEPLEDEEEDDSDEEDEPEEEEDDEDDEPAPKKKKTGKPIRRK